MEEEVCEKYWKVLDNVSYEVGLVFYFGNVGIDLFKFDLDIIIKLEDLILDGWVQFFVFGFKYWGNDVLELIFCVIGKFMFIGGNGFVLVGMVVQVVDYFEDWVKIVDLDGFNVGYVVSFGSFEDVVDFFVLEFWWRGIYVFFGESGMV